MKRRLLIASLAIGSLFGCATIIRGPTQTITINSNVSGAIAFINGESIGPLPVVYRATKRREGLTLQVEAPGHIPIQRKISSKLDVIFFGNFILGGFIGSTTDLVSGAMWEYSPDNIYVNLMRANLMLDEQKNQQKMAAVRYLVLMNHDVLAREIAVGSGGKLDLLQQVLSDSSVTIKHLRAVVETAENPIELAHGMVALLPQQI